MTFSLSNLFFNFFKSKKLHFPLSLLLYPFLSKFLLSPFSVSFSLLFSFSDLIETHRRLCARTHPNRRRGRNSSFNSFSVTVTFAFNSSCFRRNSFPSTLQLFKSPSTLFWRHQNRSLNQSLVGSDFSSLLCVIHILVCGFSLVRKCNGK